MADVAALRKELEDEMLDWDSTCVLHGIAGPDDDGSITAALRLLGWCFSGLAVVALLGIPTAPAHGVWPYLLGVALVLAAIGGPCLVVARKRRVRAGQLRAAHRGRVAQIKMTLANAERVAREPAAPAR